MTPQGKKALIVISTFVIVGGAIGFYFWHKKKKEKEAGGNTSAEPASETNTASGSTPNVTPPSGVTPLPDAPPPTPKVKSASGYYLNQPMYFVKGREATTALSYPEISSKNSVGVINRSGDKPAATFVSDAGAKGYSKVVAVVKDAKGNYSAKTVYVLTSHFTPNKP